MKKGIWEGRVRKNTSMKALEPCHQAQGEICTKEGKGVLVIKRGERRDVGICRRSIEKRLYLAI